MKLLKPKALKPGDRLGLMTSSTPLSASSQDAIQRCQAYLEAKGFELVEADNCRKLHGHAAGTVRERVQALHRFFRNPKIVGILSYWGGFQSHQLLEYLDFDLIRRNPKVLIGYSDTTALTVGIHARTGLVTFSGPAGISYGKPLVPEFTWRHFESVVMKVETPFRISTAAEFSDNKWYLENPPALVFETNPGWKVFRGGKARGPVIGGNLGTLLLLAGTPCWPRLKGAILFVEEDESESPKTVDRMFTQLRQMGVLDQLAGMVIGRFAREVGFQPADSLEMILEDALRGCRFPVITDVDFGHTDPLITFPLGVTCQINSRGPEIVFLESAVRREPFRSRAV